MTQRIIYQTDEGGVAIIIPTPEALVAEKQRLRDITTLVDTANTVEELKALEIK